MKVRGNYQKINFMKSLLFKGASQKYISMFLIYTMVEHENARLDFPVFLNIYVIA